MADKSVTVNIGGTDYKISPLSVSDYRELESFIRQNQLRDYYTFRSNFDDSKQIDEASRKILLDKTLSKEEKDIFIDNLRNGLVQERTRIVKNILSDPIDVQTRNSFEKSVDGLMFIMWKAIKKNHPEMTFEKTCDLLKDDESLNMATDVLTGLNEEQKESKNPQRAKVVKT